MRYLCNSNVETNVFGVAGHNEPAARIVYDTETKQKCKWT